MRIALIEKKVIVNAFEAASLDEIAVGKGQTVMEWEAAVAAGNTIPPLPEPEPKRQFTFLEFMDLFTDAEQLSIAGAAMTNAATKLWYDRAIGAQFISLDDARLTAGLDAMVAAELLEPQRRDRVLAGFAPALPLE